METMETINFKTYDMAMNKFQTDRLMKKLKCFSKKNRREESYAFILGDKMGVVITEKDGRHTLVFSTEDPVFGFPKDRKMKKTSFNACMKKMVSMAHKAKTAKFPIEAYGFASVFLNAFTKEAQRMERPKSTTPPIQCKGG